MKNALDKLARELVTNARIGIPSWMIGALMSIIRSYQHGRHLLGVIVLTGFVAGCSSIPKEAYRLPQSSLSEREAQTRTFDVSDDSEIFQASVALLQDMEYNVDAIEQPLGVLSASKVVDADSAQQKAALVAADVALVILSVISGTSVGGSAYAGADDEISLYIQPNAFVRF